MSADAGAPDAASQKSAARTGLLAALTAYTLWGMFPLYLKALSSVPAVEILAHRIFWSAPFGALILTARHQWADVFAALRSPRIVGALSIAALAIALN
ncbi:MAG: EamA family transporter RarD, partial [Pseudomonadota bacterium]